MAKKIKIAIISLLIILVCLIAFLLFYTNTPGLKTIKSDDQLLQIYEDNYSYSDNYFIKAITMPFSLLVDDIPDIYEDMVYKNSSSSSRDFSNSSSLFTSESAASSIDDSALSSVDSVSGSSSSKDYSTTNIQVENVDEADIIKTDGNYIYSISDNKVIITNVVNPQDIKIESTISPVENSIPEDLILYKNELIVISDKNSNSSSSYSYSYSYNSNTIVQVYNIENKAKPTLAKSYELYQPYYTSRCINNELYIISSGTLRKKDNKIIRTYKENNSTQEISLENFKYLKDVQTKKQTIIATLDLDNVSSNVNISSYLIDISNAYVSENSIYLLNQKYERDDDIPPLKTMFGLKGIFGLFNYDSDETTSGYTTKIYKFDILKDGTVTYNTKNKILGKTINQYSLDEQNGHLRVALYDNNGSRVAIFDKNLNQIGLSNYVAQEEKMYSSRFMGNKAYFVTYRTMDPLFVIDLSNESQPEILGELHIPGYSTYLHPYDENHLIGIGMETEEIVNRNSTGKVTSTSSRIIGMKMALFDVTDVNQPIQLSQTVIGDRRTTSAILTNPKALLFSKEKQLIAIPVNNYSEDFDVSSSGDSYSSVINSYKSYSKPRIAEGYFVYKLNLQDGFKLKGTITHETSSDNKSLYYSYNPSKLLRGLYINNNLYTVSETAVKVNNLDTLELVDEIKIKSK